MFELSLLGKNCKLGCYDHVRIGRVRDCAGHCLEQPLWTLPPALPVFSPSPSQWSDDHLQLECPLRSHCASGPVVLKPEVDVLRPGPDGALVRLHFARPSLVTLAGACLGTAAASADDRCCHCVCRYQALSAACQRLTTSRRAARPQQAPVALWLHRVSAEYRRTVTDCTGSAAAYLHNQNETLAVSRPKK
jgi:hypothetical protein